MKRAIIIHGWEASPDANWFSAVSRDLSGIGYEVAVPQMPNTRFPKKEEWLGHLADLIGMPDEELVLIGHSLGCITVLRYLESLPVGQKVGKIVLVAGFSESVGIDVIEGFTDGGVNFDKIRGKYDRAFVFHAKNDPYVPFSLGEKLVTELSADFYPFETGEHLNLGTGYFSFPQIAEVIKN